MPWTRERVMTGSRIRQRRARLKRIEDRLGSPALEANSIARARFEKLWLAEKLTPDERQELNELGERLEPNWYELLRHIDEHPLYQTFLLQKWRCPFDEERKKRRLRFDQIWMKEGRTPDEETEFEKLASEFILFWYS